MTLAKNDIENAQREAALDRAHEMCIDKIKELSEQNESIVKANHGLIDTQNRLQREIGTMTIALEQIAALDHYSDEDDEFIDSGSIARNALNNH